MGKMFFEMLAVFAEFEVDLLRMRTREGMTIARAKGKLKGKAPKLSATRQAHLVKLHEAGCITSPSCSRCPGRPSTGPWSARGGPRRSPSEHAPVSYRPRVRLWPGSAGIANSAGKV